jgi:spermidine/putrescine transport system permease protein
VRDSLALYVAALLPILAAIGLVANSLYERCAGRTGEPGFFQRNGVVFGTFLIVAVSFWILVTIAFPQVMMLDLSFHPNLPPKQIGGPNDVYTLSNYSYFVFGPPGSSDQLNTLHMKSYGTTILASVFITLLNLVICYPIAFFMAQSALPRTVRWLGILLILPYWVSEVLRVFAIRLLLARGGAVNGLLVATGVVTEPIDFIGNNVALYWGLSYSCILVMVFTLYNSLESLGKNQLEAARDLGAPWWHIHLFVVMPHAKPGIASGCALTFMSCVGSLAAPLILGGPRTLWFTPVIYNRFYQALNWPQGTAYAVILLVSCVAFVLVTLKMVGLKLGQIAR